jgi:hypothetical protein
LAVQTDFSATLSDSVGFSELYGGSISFFVTISESLVLADTLNARLLWELIDDSETANWQNINSAQTPTWTLIGSNQTPGWQDINLPQSPNWSDINSNQTPGWDDIDTV